MEHLIIFGLMWVLLGRWFWWGSSHRAAWYGARRADVRSPYQGHQLGCGRGESRRAMQGDHRVGQRVSAAGVRVGRREMGSEADAVHESRAVAAEDPVARLQREWIHGQITDREYEAALDAIYSKTQ